MGQKHVYQIYLIFLLGIDLALSDLIKLESNNFESSTSSFYRLESSE
jgi:hypothetical protein